MKIIGNRIGGVFAVLGGIYLLVLFLFQVFGGELEDGGLFWQLLPLMTIFLVLGAVGLLALSADQKGLKVGVVVLGLGAAIMAIGLGMMAWFINEYGWLVMMVGLLAQPLGFLIFGLANWRAKVLQRGNGIPLFVGIICTLLLLSALVFGDMDGATGQQSELLFGGFLLTLAAGWIVLGLNMLISDRDSAVPITTSALFLLVLLLGACSGGSQPQVSFQNLKDGQEVASPVRVVMGAENFTVEAAGDVHEGAGHLHIMIDTPCLPSGEVIPKDDNHRHFGDGSLEADLELAPGTHTLCLQAADGAHIALDGPGMRQQISVTVP